MARGAPLFLLSLVLWLVPLVAGKSASSSVLETKVTRAEGGRGDGGASRGRELYYFGLKHRDAPYSPFLRRYKSRSEFLRTVLQRDEERAKSFLEHLVQRRPRRATGMATEKGFVAMDAGSPPHPRSREAGEAGALLLPPAGEGEYYTELYVGTPRQLQVAMVDLGSDLVWIGEPSSRLRKRRIDGDAAVYSQDFYTSSSSSSFTPIPASSGACVAVEGVHVRGDRKACRVAVGTGEQYIGALEFAYEDIRLNRTEQHTGSVMRNIMISVSKVHVATGGVLGLGLGKTSFATQMANRNSNKFAYCLSDTDEPSGSSLVFGAGEGESNLEFTPLVTHPHVDSFYFVNLVAVAVNGAKLPIPSGVLKMSSKGEGGTIVDMSTRFSRFPKRAFQHLVEAMKARIELPATAVIPGFHLCYSMANSDILRVPSLTLTFENGARMKLPMENLFVSASERGDVMCLAMVPGAPGTPTVIGSTQQQNFLMVVDRGRSRLGFAPRQCASRPNL
jgi:hypothetical protein